MNQNNQVNCLDNNFNDNFNDTNYNIVYKVHNKNSEYKSKKELLNCINSTMCYFDRYNIPANINLVCYYCTIKCHSSDISKFTCRYIDGKNTYDVPICPNCHIDAIISIDKLKQKKIGKSILYQMRKLVFE